MHEWTTGSDEMVKRTNEELLDAFTLEPYEQIFESGSKSSGLRISGWYDDHQYEIILQSGAVPADEVNETNIGQFIPVEVKIDGDNMDKSGNSNLAIMESGQQFVRNNLREIYYRKKLKEVTQARKWREEENQVEHS